jgi:DNA invertase Pin-like site-specific DNA recombinase
MRAVIYRRVSTVEQTQNLSLSTQEEACREYCRRHGYEVDEVFVDAGESAKTTDRPEFRRMLAHCRRSRGRLHAVVVYSLTRFSRNNADHHAIATLLRGLGIALRSVTEPIDDSPSGRLMEGILASMAQFDNDVRSERVTAGLKAAVGRGRWAGVRRSATSTRPRARARAWCPTRLARRPSARPSSCARAASSAASSSPACASSA